MYRMLKNTRGVKIIIGFGILVLFTYITYTLLQKQSPTQSSENPQATPTTVPEQSSFEKSSGNNSVAKTYAQQLTNETQKIQPGLVTHVDLQITPKDTNTTSSVTFIKASIKVNKMTWDSLTDTQRQELLTTYRDTLRFSPNTAEGFTITDIAGTILVTGHQ